MKAEITPTEKIQQLKENLEKRVEQIREKGEKLEAEVGDKDVLKKVAGIESFKVDGEKFEGLKGSPVDQQVYTELKTREDVVRAFLATRKGYDLVVLETDRRWDLRKLRDYNPDIKHLKSREPEEVLEIEKSITELEDTEKVDIEMPSDEEVEKIYREMLT